MRTIALVYVEYVAKKNSITCSSVALFFLSFPALDLLLGEGVSNDAPPHIVTGLVVRNLTKVSRLPPLT
jgi:hypothetical protein